MGYLAALFLPLVMALSTDSSIIRPGERWLDTEGRPIQAHGGGILFQRGVYYWYGEEKSRGDNNRTGVACYSSTDLVHWKNEGLALPKAGFPEEFQDTGVCERPKVIYNAKTKKYVMWMHLDARGYSAAEAGVAVADRPAGPFKLVSHSRPIASSTFRDMNLFVDSDHSAYVLYAGEDNATLNIHRLTDDYLSVVEPKVEGETWARAMVGKYREAPAPFKHKGTYYIISSACTGWAPNEAGYATAPSILGPWTEHPNPCVGPEAKTTFGGQSTYVLPIQGKPDSFIFMADRWKPNDLGDSRYVWLPFTIKPDGSFEVVWQDQWDMASFLRK